MITKYLTLLPGTQLLLGESQILILPEDHSYNESGEGVSTGDAVVLENQLREVIGTAKVLDIIVLPFSQLQQWHFKGSANPDLTSWHVSADFFRENVPGFSITDPASVVAIEVDTLLEPGINIRITPTEDTPTDPVVVVTQEHYEELNKWHEPVEAVA